MVGINLTHTYCMLLNIPTDKLERIVNACLKCLDPSIVKSNKWSLFYFLFGGFLVLLVLCLISTLFFQVSNNDPTELLDAIMQNIKSYKSVTNLCNVF